jgi:hypothetical protein
MLLIPVTWEADIEKIMVGGQLRQKVNKNTFQPINQMWQRVPVISAMREV